MAESSAKNTELKFRGEADLATLRELLRAVDRSPAVTWTGNGGVKERILRLIEDQAARGG